MSTSLHTGEVETDLYLRAVVILLPEEPPGARAELMESVLDGHSNAREGEGRWRRFYTDNATIKVCFVGEAIWPFVQPYVKLTPEAAREAIYCLVEEARQWQPDSWRVHDFSFTIGGVVVFLMECWTTKPFHTSPMLICPECKESYDLSTAAGIVTPELMKEVLVERGNNVLILRNPGSPPPIPQDVVIPYEAGNTKHPEQFIRSLQQVLLDLQHELPRRWRCKQNHLNGYPGSFSRYVFAHINIQPQTSDSSRPSRT